MSYTNKKPILFAQLQESGCCKTNSSCPVGYEIKCDKKLLHTEVDNTSVTTDTEVLENSDATLDKASLLSRASVAMDVNNTNHVTLAAELSCLSQACRSAHVEATTGSHSNSLKLQSPPPTDTDYTNIESTPHSVIATNMSSEEQSSPSCSCPGSRVTGHNDNMPTGARPKLVAARTIKKNIKSRNPKKSVRWSEETKSISTIDAITYEHYRKCLLELSIPRTGERNAALEAVLFMSDREQSDHLELVIDMAYRFLWARQDRSPTASELYRAVGDFEYDERNIVVAFQEMWHTRFENSSANIEQHNSLHCTEEAQRALDNQVTAHVSQLPNNVSDLQPQVPQLQNNVSDLQPQVSQLENNVFDLRPQVSQLQNNVSDVQSHIPEKCETSEINSAASLKCWEIQDKQHKKLLPQEELRREQMYALRKEQEYLKASMMCVLCKVKQIEVTLLPCGHFVLCAACSENCNICPVCNTRAIAEVKTFLC
jgi:gas vesicle protein